MPQCPLYMHYYKNLYINEVSGLRHVSVGREKSDNKNVRQKTRGMKKEGDKRIRQLLCVHLP